jgi:hypothetical protein
MGVVKMKMAILKGILLILKLLWRCVEHAMIWCISTRKKAEKKGGCCECDNTRMFDPYNSSQSACSLSVEEETCLALARLYDNPESNDIDCPWDWKK